MAKVEVLRLSENIAYAALNWSYFLRRLIFGKEFIEGDWVEGCLSTDHNTLLAITLLRIEWGDNRLKLGGEVYNCDGYPIANFTSSGIGYDNLVLWYVYQRHSPREKGKRPVGRGELRFTASRSSSTSYYGSFFDLVTEKEIEVVGRKLTSKNQLDRLNDTELRAQVVLEAVEYFRKSYPDYLVSDRIYPY